MPMRRAVLMIRQAISPRLAIRMRLNIAAILSASRSLAFAALSSKCQMQGARRWYPAGPRFDRRSLARACHNTHGIKDIELGDEKIGHCSFGVRGGRTRV